MKKSYDLKCQELAEYFLLPNAAPVEVEDLAVEIQETIEDFLLRRRLEK